jgi:hypothetical protein
MKESAFLLHLSVDFNALFLLKMDPTYEDKRQDLPDFYRPFQS